MCKYIICSLNINLQLFTYVLLYNFDNLNQRQNYYNIDDGILFIVGILHS